jgi:hypothetical protein
MASSADRKSLPDEDLVCVIGIERNLAVKTVLGNPTDGLFERNEPCNEIGDRLQIESMVLFFALQIILRSIRVGL